MLDPFSGIPPPATGSGRIPAGIRFVQAPSMSALNLDTKKLQILANEQLMAQRLAREVIDRPMPSAWMILVPVYFLFYAIRLKDYAKGLDIFAGQYLRPRCRLLEAAAASLAANAGLDIEPLVAQAESIPDTARPHYRFWLSLLGNHYRNLLAADGETLADLTRSHYRCRSSLLLHFRQLHRAEAAFNTSLLPSIAGDCQDIRDLVDRLNHAVQTLQQQEAERIFC